MKKVAITGGLACGKSSVCQFLQELGAVIVSADQIVHQLLSNHVTLRKQIVNLLGDEVIVNGELNRQAIAKKVFNHEELLLQLESILHPAVYEEIELRYQEYARNSSALLMVVEVPLLFESGGQGQFDATVAIVSDETLCRQRYARTDYEQRQLRQFSQKAKSEKADFILTNNGSLEELKAATHKLYDQLINTSSSNHN